MSWFRVDDKFYDHPKAMKAGAHARNLWNRVGTWCSSFNTDGRVDGEIIAELAPSAGVTKWRAAVAKLVEVRLWHDHDTLTGCSSCTDHLHDLNLERKKHGEDPVVIGPGDYFFHQWWERQEPRKARRSSHAKAAEDRLRALHRNADLTRAIQLRDRDHCRYCYVEVHWSDRKSARRPTYDHVDPLDFEPPDGGNRLDNVVVACKMCNGRKGKRTPEEWAADPAKPGLLLKPPYEPPPSVTPGTKSDPESDPDLPRSTDSGPENPDPEPENLTGSSRDARLGPGRVGSDPGSDSGSDPGRADPGRGRGGPGLVGLVRGEAGPGTDGTGLVGFGPGREPPPGGDTDPPPDRTRAADDAAEDSR